MDREKVVQELLCILNEKYGLYDISENDNLFESISNFTEIHMVFLVMDNMKKYKVNFPEKAFQNYEFVTISNIADKIINAYNFN